MSLLCKAFAAGAALSFVGVSASAMTYSVVHNFSAGAYAPDSRLVQDQNGILWGTTQSSYNHPYGGKVFSLDPGSGVVKLWPSFSKYAYSGGLVYENGYLWGVTNNEVVRLDPSTGRLKVVSGVAGSMGGLMADSNGNLWGTTEYSGSVNCGGTSCGTVFEITPNGSSYNYTTVHNFSAGTDGRYPLAGLMQDANGNIWGTTSEGGANTQCTPGGIGCGTVFEIAADGTYSVVYSFGANSSDGTYPASRLMQDRNGNIWGTTQQGGGGNCTTGLYGGGCGTVFEIAADGTYSVVHRFGGPGTGDGAWPFFAGLIHDTNGSLWGTTLAGDGKCWAGTAFEIASNGTYSVAHCFTGGKTDGESPGYGLMLDTSGNLWGTTELGGSKTCDRSLSVCGTAFEITP